MFFGIGMRMLVPTDRENKKTMYIGEYLDQKGRSNEKLQKIMCWERYSVSS
jgi:hypothetical protein